MLRGSRGPILFYDMLHGEGVDVHDVGVAVDDVAVDDVAVDIGVSGGGDDRC